MNYTSDKAGKPIALSKDQLAQVESLTREAMGFSTVRGDTLNVVNTPSQPVTIPVAAAYRFGNSNPSLISC